MTGEHHIQNNAERIDIGTSVDILATTLFWTHELRCAEDCALTRLAVGRGIGDFGNPKIEDLCTEPAGYRLKKHDVLGFQITVNDGRLMRGGQSISHLKGNVDNLVLRKGVFRFDIGCQRLASHVLHDDAKLAVDIEKVVNLDGVGMRYLAVGFGFRDEAVDEFLIFAKITVELLDRHFLVNTLLTCKIDLTHATFGNAFGDDVFIIDAFANEVRRLGHESGTVAAVLGIGNNLVFTFWTDWHETKIPLDERICIETIGGSNRLLILLIMDNRSGVYHWTWR